MRKPLVQVERENNTQVSAYVFAIQNASECDYKRQAIHSRKERRMRLIDADALHTSLVKMNDFGELSAKKAIRMVSKAPTVDAIPVEWLEDLHKKAQSEEADRMIDEIISLWEARKNER